MPGITLHDQEQETQAVELHRKYRPKTWEEIIGQDDAVETIRNMIEKKRLPQVILLSGNPGVGKNCIAYLIQQDLKVSDTDFIHINCADNRGIDMVRDLGRRINSVAMES